MSENVWTVVSVIPFAERLARSCPWFVAISLTRLPLASKNWSILTWPGPWWNVTGKLQSSPGA